MKKTIFLCALCLLIPAACKPVDKTANTPATGDISKSEVSYALGVSIGDRIKSLSFTLDYNAFLSGVRDVMDKNAPKYSAAEANNKINAALTAIEEKKAQEALANEKSFLEKNKKRAGVITTPSGLQYEVIKEGTGKQVVISDVVDINYIGTFPDGKEFANTYTAGKPETYGLYSLIPGWQEGIPLMKIGSKYKFYIAAALGYGPNGYGSSIPPNSTLIYELEVVSVMNRTKQ